MSGASCTDYVTLKSACFLRLGSAARGRRKAHAVTDFGNQGTKNPNLLCGSGSGGRTGRTPNRRPSGAYLVPELSGSRKKIRALDIDRSLGIENALQFLATANLAHGVGVVIEVPPHGEVCPPLKAD